MHVMELKHAPSVSDRIDGQECRIKFGFLCEVYTKYFPQKAWQKLIFFTLSTTVSLFILSLL